MLHKKLPAILDLYHGICFWTPLRNSHPQTSCRLAPLTS